MPRTADLPLVAAPFRETLAERLGLSNHALARAREREVPLAAIRLVLLLGRAELHRGGYRFTLKGAHQPAGVSSEAWLDALTVVVVVSGDGTVTTVFRKGC